MKLKEFKNLILNFIERFKFKKSVLDFFSNAPYNVDIIYPSSKLSMEDLLKSLVYLCDSGCDLTLVFPDNDTLQAFREVTEYSVTSTSMDFIESNNFEDKNFVVLPSKRMTKFIGEYIVKDTSNKFLLLR